MKTLEKNEQELHVRFVEYGANAKTWMRKCVLLLPEINRLGIWHKKGFGSIYEYAAKLAGMSRNTVDEALRILEKIEDKPNLRLVAKAKGLGAVRPVITMATSENEKFWARKAAAMSKNTLETYVREYRRQGGGIDTTGDTQFALEFRPGTEIQSKKESSETGKAASGGASGDALTNVADTLTLSMTLDREAAETLQKLKGQGDWNSLMKELLRLREEKLAAEEPEPVVNAKRYVPARIKNHVLAKTNGQCAYPGCTKPYKILHHTQRFALERTHDPKRLMPLCKGHEQLAHQGLIRREQGETRRWEVRAEADRERPEYQVDRKVMGYRKNPFL